MIRRSVSGLLLSADVVSELLPVTPQAEAGDDGGQLQQGTGNGATHGESSRASGPGSSDPGRRWTGVVAENDGRVGDARHDCGLCGHCGHGHIPPSWCHPDPVSRHEAKREMTLARQYLLLQMLIVLAVLVAVG